MISPALQQKLQETGHRRSLGELREINAVGGGSISGTYRVGFSRGSFLFLKTRSTKLDQFYRVEAEGLAALRSYGTLRVPEVVEMDDEHVPPFLLLEYLETGPKPAGFFADFGAQLAESHRSSGGESYGFHRNGYLGATPQLNPPTESWVEFYREYRLGFQIERARKKDLTDRSLDRKLDALVSRLEKWIPEPAEQPCLIHGDLWGGNFMVGVDGEPILVDPAPYYGTREAELAMTRLFGGFSPEFYCGYQEVWPLETGYQDRIPLYELYHLLNHLNLFGAGYLGRCRDVLRRYE